MKLGCGHYFQAGANVSVSRPGNVELAEQYMGGFSEENSFKFWVLNLSNESDNLKRIQGIICQSCHKLMYLGNLLS